MPRNKTKYEKAIEILVFWVFSNGIRVFVVVSLIVSLLRDFRDTEIKERERQILERDQIWVLLFKRETNKERSGKQIWNKFEFEFCD